MSYTATYAVKGMTCDHCVRAVEAELSAVPGVTAVEVDLAAATAVVTSKDPIEAKIVREAVEEAGYESSGVVQGDPGS